jgi:hypothetical protein
MGRNASHVAVSHTFLAGSLQLGRQRMKSPVANARCPVDPLEGARTASRASLRCVSCSDGGIRRVKRGKGFVYFLPNGRRVTDARELERIRKLALPFLDGELMAAQKSRRHGLNGAESDLVAVLESSLHQRAAA